MSSNRLLRSNIDRSSAASPSLAAKKSDSSLIRSSSPPNYRSSFVKQHDNPRSESPTTKSFTDDDIKFHRIVFERNADLPGKHLITNQEKFFLALNYVGYDLPKATMIEIWDKNDREINFKTFQRILTEQKPIDERILEEAFTTLYNKDQKYDWNSIDFNTFRKDMLEKGDRFTEDEFQRIRFLLGTDAGKINIKKLTKTIGENKHTCRQKLITDKKEQKRDEFERPSPRGGSPKSNTIHLIIDPTSDKLSIPPRIRSLQMKGAFFCEYFDSPTDALYFTIGYSFEIKKSSPIWITLEPKISSRYHPNTLYKNLDIRILLFEKIPRAKERHLIHVSSHRSGNKSYIHLNELSRGSYEIIPVTFGGVLRARSRELNERPPIKTLRETKKGNHVAMSNDYRDALEYVFDLFDFDDNKQLDRHEYNLWTLRTAGEEITDEDWSTIRDNIKLDVDENISKKKFLELNNFEVQDEKTTEQDLWIGLKAVGFNSALELDMMCPFNLTIHINEPDVHLRPTSYVELAEIKKILIKFLENKGEKIKLTNPSIQCFNYSDDCGSILYAQNKSSSNVRLSIQVTKSINTALNLPIDARKPPVINIRHDTTQILWFAHKLDNQRIMELDANIQIQ